MTKKRLQLRITLDPSDNKALTWYPDAAKLIRELYGEFADLFCDILAATSPRQTVKKNWRMSVAILDAYKNRQMRPDKLLDVLTSKDVLPAHLNNVIRALQRRPIKGPKVSRFAANLKGDLSAVTIDAWICKAYGIDRKELTPRLYNRLERKIQADAAERGISPANWQAVLWYAVRRLSGKNPKSFVSVYHSIFMETPCFEFMQENE